jgi:hypothetical protein
MINVAALVNDLAISQKTFYLISQFNQCIDNTDLSVGVFNIRASRPPIKPLFGCKNVAFLNAYNGVVISTTMEEAEISLKASNNSKKFLYLWDLDWLENPVYFSVAMRILRDDRLKIIARSSSHAEMIEEFTNRPVEGIVDNWDMDQLLGIVTSWRTAECN